MNFREQGAKAEEDSGKPAPFFLCCDEARSLLDRFAGAVHAAAEIHREQLGAISDEGSEAIRFDILIHEACERKQEAEYAYLAHIQNHGCSTVNTTTMTTLTLDERERIIDSALKIQSVCNSLGLVAPHKVPSMSEMLACLKRVDQGLREALGYVRKLKPAPDKAERL